MSVNCFSVSSTNAVAKAVDACTATSGVEAVAAMLMKGLPATGDAEMSMLSGTLPIAFSVRWCESLFRIET